MALTQTVPMFGSICTEFRHIGPPRLLPSDNSAEAPALVRPDSTIVYFAPDISRMPSPWHMLFLVTSFHVFIGNGD